MTQQQLAQQVLQKRIEIENSAVRNVLKEIDRVFSELVKLGYGADITGRLFRFSDLKQADKERLDKILADLRLFVYMVAETASQKAVDEVEKNYGAAVAFVVSTYLNRETNDKTAKERFAIYVNRLKYEMEMWIAAGKLGKKTESELIDEFKANRTTPYSNELYRHAMAYKPRAVRFHELPHHGRGNYMSAVALLQRYETWLIMDNMRMAQFMSFGSGGKLVGYMVGRGSSYPCDSCEEITGFHQIGYEELPPYHSHCKCWAYPVYE